MCFNNNYAILMPERPNELLLTFKDTSEALHLCIGKIISILTT